MEVHSYKFVDKKMRCELQGVLDALKLVGVIHVLGVFRLRWFGLHFRPGGAFPSFVFLVPVCGKVRYRF
jgi:hypothetical protein